MANFTSNKQAFIRLMNKSEEHAEHGFKLLLKRNDFADFFDEIKAAGLFDPSKNKGPEPVPGKEGHYTISFWEALPYLEAVARKAGEDNSSDLANKVLDVIRAVSGEQVDGKPKDNYHTWRIFTEILSLIPSNTVTLADIDLLSIWLESDWYHGSVGHVLGGRLLPKWLSSENTADWEKACQVLYYSLGVKWKSKRGDEDNDPISVIEDYWLKELLNRNVEALGQKCGEEASAIFLERLKEVYSKVEEKIPSWSTRPAIEDHTQNHSWKGIENSLVEGLRDVVNIWLQNDLNNAKPFVQQLLKGELEIERRIGIYLVNANYERLKELLDETIPLLLDTGHIHEMYELLQSRFAEFDAAQKQQVLKTILSIPKPQKDRGDAILQRNQRNWLNAIKGKGLPEADKLFSQLDANPELGKVSNHPGFISWMEMRWGPGPSQYGSSELISFLENGVLIEKLNDFQGREDFWSDTPTVKALVDSLEESVAKEPLKFTLALADFQQAKRPYQYGIINGFKKLWDATTSNDVGIEWGKTWEQLLTFFESILYDEAFWTETVEESGDLTPTKAWIPSLIADFLRAGVKKDDKSIAASLLPKVQKLIVTLLEKLPSEWRADNSDAMTQAINKEKGKAVEALVDYALCLARLSDKEQKEHETAWEKVEHIFDEQLSQCKGTNQEFSTLMGAYCANLEYLNYEWLKQNVTQIFPFKYPDNFACAVRGLAYAQASKKLYSLLRDSEIIQTALENKIDGQHARENLLERIALAYIWGDETLDSKRFQYLFKSENADDLYEIAKFFWKVHEQELEQKQVEHILSFWKECIEWAKRQKEAPQSLLSMMSLLISYLDVISDEQKQWLMSSVPYIAKKHNADFFLEELARLADSNAETVKDIFVKMLETYAPYYDFEGTLFSIISTLVEKGFKAEMLPILEKLRRIEGFQAYYTQITA